MKVPYEKPLVETFDFLSQEKLANDTGVDPGLSGGFGPVPANDEDD